jgi:hypothetical protein
VNIYDNQINSILVTSSAKTGVKTTGFTVKKNDIAELTFLRIEVLRSKGIRETHLYSLGLCNSIQLLLLALFSIKIHEYSETNIDISLPSGQKLKVSQAGRLAATNCCIRLSYAV